MTTIRNWWATHSPFALQRDLVHGPMRPRDKVVFCITASLGIGLVLFLIFAAALVTP